MNLHHMDEFLRARLHAKLAFSREKPAEELPFEATAGYRTMIDQGLRLHKAFRNIGNSALREAIVTFVAELAKGENVG
jgi:hypothetical protein